MKEPNILNIDIFLFFRPSPSRVLFPMFCLDAIQRAMRMSNIIIHIKQSKNFIVA